MKVWGELTDPDRTLRGPSRELDVLNVRYLLSMRRQRKDGTDVQEATLSSPPAASASPPATKSLGVSLFGETDWGPPTRGGGRRLAFTTPPVETDAFALV